MRSLLPALSLVVFCACPAPPGMDGGTGGGGVLGGGGGGGTGGGTGGGSSGPLTFTAYCSTLQATYCDYGARCGLFDTRMGCEDLLARSSGLNCDYLGPSVRDGRATFDGTRAGQCFDAIATGCAMPASCSGDFFAGTVPLDGGCFVGDDCVNTAYCDSSQMVCPGRCIARVGAGQFVENYSACQEGLNPTFGRSDAGMFGYVCTPKATLGQQCVGYGGCVDDLVCNEESGACETRRGPNSVCSFADGGVPDFTICQANLYCQPEGSRWVCNAPGAIGARCGTCRFDLRCAPADGGTGVCAARSGLNGDCARSTDCQLGFFCKASGSGPFGPGTCQPPGALGAECNGSSDSCQSSNRCTQVANPDGGIFQVYRCVASDGGVDNGGCVDPTP
ncbi:MAG: hypothetical protein Q8L48_29595 [Archangium sp.]|nr:hypothetical protein [Archangium sp.]